MAIQTLTTVPVAPEAGRSAIKSPVIDRFLSVTRDLSAYVVAKRDLTSSNSPDLACAAWPRDAARARVLASLALLLDTRIEVPEELPLRHWCIITRLMITGGTVDDYARAVNLPRQKPHLYQSCGNAFLAGQINRMIDEFRASFEDLARLSDFADTSDLGQFKIEIRVYSAA